ncbi:hypothetical protein V6N11_037049 [Hibiscus sabdariffa]|uniref:Glutamyl-tRNA reductase N-terminal domain-containing protein n=1 Tax=Hibiscus sabdariffa TaxID=183260 RepID=A0ABR2A939_9ROSI
MNFDQRGKLIVNIFKGDIVPVSRFIFLPCFNLALLRVELEFVKKNIGVYDNIAKQLLTKVDGYTKEMCIILFIRLRIHTAPMEMREKIALLEVECPRFTAELGNLSHIEEVAILSTCDMI